MELLEIEEKTESELCLKEQELELAKVELEAWNDEVDSAVSTMTPNVLESCGPVSSNVCKIASEKMCHKMLKDQHKVLLMKCTQMLIML